MAATPKGPNCQSTPITAMWAAYITGPQLFCVLTFFGCVDRIRPQAAPEVQAVALGISTASSMHHPEGI